MEKFKEEENYMINRKKLYSKDNGEMARLQNTKKLEYLKILIFLFINSSI